MLNVSRIVLGRAICASVRIDLLPRKAWDLLIHRLYGFNYSGFLEIARQFFDQRTSDFKRQAIVLRDRGLVITRIDNRDFIDRIVTSVVVSDGDGQWTEYAGGYTDMLAQKALEAPDKPLTRKEAKAAEKVAAAVLAGPGAARRKMSFKEKHALEALPKEMEFLTGEMARLEKILADPKLFARDRVTFEDTSRKLTAARTRHAGAEDEWLALEVLRGELEG